MKNILLLILISVGLLFSAEFKLISYSVDMMDMDARQSNVLDDNGNRPGLLKIYSAETGFLIESNLGVIETDRSKHGEFWVFLSQGEKWIKISKEGYSPFEYVLEPAIESDFVYVLRLGTVAFGNVMDDDMHRVTFNLNIPNTYISKGSSAPVQVSGKITEYNLPKGDHEFTFIKEGYKDKKETVNVQSDIDINIVMEEGSNFTQLKLPALVTITSEPAGADIFLNGQKFGVTPMQEMLMPGEYSINVRRPLYYTYEGTFTVREGQTAEIPIIKLKEKTAAFYTVKSDQPGTKIYIGGVFVGEAPIEKQKIESGKYSFKAEHDLYYSDTKEIEFKENDDTIIDFKLRAAHGSLNIKSEPAGASVWLNETEIGVTPLSKKVRSGIYKLRLSKDLWSDHTETIEIKDNITIDRSFSLNKNFGMLSIKSDDADIYINGKLEGKGTFKLDLKPGQYQILAKKASHRDDSREVF
jgi:hypothetical protein